MMRSLFSAVAGLRAHQTRMDVIGNNIANVNTYGFKASRVTFRDVYYQTLSGGSQASTINGGTNPTQIGYGAKVASIDVMHGRSGDASTDRARDASTQGDGFIKVTPQNGGEEYYTRMGALDINQNGDVVDLNGNFVFGVTTTAGAPPTTTESTTFPFNIKNTVPANASFDMSKVTSIAIGEDGKITYTQGSTVYTTVDSIGVYRFPNNGGLVEVGASYYQKGANTGNPTPCQAGADGAGKLSSGYLEMSNVDLSKEFTDMIITQRGFQANSRIITVSDSMLEELVNLKR